MKRHCALRLLLQWLGPARSEWPDPSQPFGPRMKQGISPPLVRGGSPTILAAGGNEVQRGAVGELAQEEGVSILGMGRREAHR
jgi:hypothetical protein